ncbi:TetR family transcriptional regulator, partial [Virgibacillus sp. 7505]
SYYFGGKQALFESLLIDFFEGYVKTMETAAREPNGDPIDSLVELFNKVLLYQQSCHWLARMAHREMTLDSTLVREVMSTY